MQQGSSGPPFGRGRGFPSILECVFDDPFFSDPFFEQRSPFFPSPFPSRPFGGLLEELLLHRYPIVHGMQGANPRSTREQTHQLLPDPRIVEMEPGDGMPSSWEQPLVEHPDSDAEDEDEEEEGMDDEEEEDAAGRAPFPKRSHKSVRNIPIQWGDEAPPPSGVAPSVVELDPDVDMDWQPAHGPATLHVEGGGDRGSLSPLSRQGANSQSAPQQPEYGRRDRERSFPRSWFSHLGRKGASG